MPRYEIHDAETGLKLLVEGNGHPPTEAESKALIDDELSFLRTNIYHGPEGRILLDVGPRKNVRRSSDEMKVFWNEFDQKRARFDEESKAVERAKKRMNKLMEGRHFSMEELTGGAVGKIWQDTYDDELKQMTVPKITPKPTMTEQTMQQLAPNTLLLIAHGDREGGLYSEGGQKFTIENLAKVLGPERSASIKRVKNLACYGGLCAPEEFGAAFPAVEEVEQSDPTANNIVSLQTSADGHYYATNTVPGLWKKFADQPRQHFDDGSYSSPREWTELPVWSEPLKPADIPILP